MKTTMNKINHDDRKHAKLSASGSSKWLNCPGSINAEDKYPDKSSSFAEEGTLAHELADICLKKRKDTEFYVGKEITGKVIEKDMARYVQEYIDFVLSHETNDSQLLTEERVDFSNVVPEGFGTMDSAIIDYNTKICHIFDLKYGKGVLVDAFENTQGQLYALGLYNELSFLGEITSFRIHIVQPRLCSFTQWDITVENLIKFGKWVSERARLALNKNAERIPGDKQCLWCRAKGDCKALYKFTEKIICAEFDNLDAELNEDVLSDDQKKNIIDNKDLIQSFLKSVERSIFERINSGGKFDGYKIVAGRSNRKWNDDAKDILIDLLKNEAYKKSLINLTEAEKKLDKEQLDSITFKPPGKPTLVPDSDKRKSIDLSIEDKFEIIR